MIEVLLTDFFPKSIEFDLYGDVSRTGRIHYHGKIRFKTIDAIKKFYLKYIYKLSDKFQIEMDTIDDEEVWDEYCTKSHHIWDIHVTSHSARASKEKSKKLFGPITKYLDGLVDTD